MAGNSPETPILVEGPIDEQILSKLNTRSIQKEFQINSCGGKTSLLDEMCIAAKYVGKMGVLVDLDKKTEAEALSQVENKLAGNFNQVNQVSENRFVVGDQCEVIVGISGLYNDEDIESLKVNQHEIEDHILKILMTDDRATERISNSNITDSDDLVTSMQRLSDILEEYSVSTDSTKFLFNLVITVLKFEGSETVFFDTLFECTDIDFSSHESTSQLVDFLHEVDAN